MFENLRSKLKGLFKKAPAEVAEEPPSAEPPVPETVTPEPQPAVAPSPEKAAEPQVAEEPKPEPKLSRKEQIKLAKEEKKKARAESDPSSVKVGEDAGLFAKRIKEDGLDDMLWELEVALMEADVALPVVEEIKQGVRDNLLGKKFSRGHTLEEVVELSLKDAVHNVLKLNEFDFDEWFSQQKRPVSIMFVGINGTGKTTAIAKIANRLQKQGMTVVMAAGDTFRAGAIEQLSIHADRLGCKIIKHNQASSTR